MDGSTTRKPALAVITAWLSLCALLVFSMVVLGGAVRLTGSGLSMVDWRPLMGAIPPLNQVQWTQVFEKYQQFPEFRLVNAGMTLSGFKTIFLMEYTHRLLGRMTGFVFLLPFLFFLLKRMVPRPVIGKLWVLFALGGLQGLLGWYMVQSGLVEDPRVSQYRLAMHLMLAVIIYATMLRVLVGLMPGYSAANGASIKTAGVLALVVILIMMTSGALVAGTHAGYSYNTWPKMGQVWLPQELLAMQPWWLNFFENTSTIQFVHRWLAVIVLLVVGNFALRLIRTDTARGGLISGYLMLVIVAGQLTLGIATLLLRVPVALAVAHQAGAMVLLTVVMVALARQLPSLAGEQVQGYRRDPEAMTINCRQI